MDSRDLTSDQSAQIQAGLRPYMLWLHKLRRRMELRGFPQTDELFTAADETYGAVRELMMRLHYLSCRRGVGREPRRPQKVDGPFSDGRATHEPMLDTRRTWQANERELNRIAATSPLDSKVPVSREDELLDQQDAIEWRLGIDHQNNARTRRWSGLQ
jgi:hypothetical protein